MPASASVVISTNVTSAPNIQVTGASGNASASTEVLAIRLRPNGALSFSVKNGLSQLATELAPLVNNHSNQT